GRDVRVEVAEVAGGDRQVLGDRGLGGPVDLVHDEEPGRVDLLHQPGDEPVAGPDRDVRLDEQADHVDLGQRGFGPLIGALAEGCPRLVETGRVDEHDLVVGSGAHAADGGAG